MNRDNRQILLRRRPDGLVSPDDVEMVTAPAPVPADGEALLRTTYVGIDAAARTWLNRARENGYEDTRAVQSILDDLRERDRSAPTYTPPTYTPPVQQAPPPQRLPASGAGPDCAHTREPIKRAQFSGVGSAGQDVRRLSEGHQRKPLYRDCASAEHRHRPHPGHAVF